MINMTLPRMLLVQQNFPDRAIRDIPAAVRKELAAAPFASRLKPGARVAIGVGSRGITNIATIVRSVVDYWKSQGMRPFIFPAMGSHGAATAEGQADVLAHYGIIEETMGCPIVSSLEVVPLGVTPGRHRSRSWTAMPIESDGVMLVGRVKWHTDFAGKIESGLFKMMAIGLGKFAGAQHYHTYAYKMGLEHVIRSIGRQVLASGKILGGLAILEDANHNTGAVDRRSRRGNGAAGRGTARPGEILDGQDPDGSRHPDPRRDRQEHQRRGHGHEGSESRRSRRVQSLAGRSHHPADLHARI